MKHKSVMKHQFSEVPKVSVPRSTFNRSHGYKTAFDAGKLVPFFVDEAIPGDTFNLKTNMIARLATPIVPIMDNIFVDTHYFAVPYRLIWDNFQKFMGEQVDPGDSTDYTIPTITSHATYGFDPNSAYDYMGLPAAITDLEVSALPMRAYALIWNQWFRDQNLQDSVDVLKGDGPDSGSDKEGLGMSRGYSLLPRGKRHDYFTSCLPWPQKGAGVELPLGTSAPISTDAIPGTDAVSVYSTVDSAQRNLYDPQAGAANIELNTFAATGESLFADLSNATAATINSLREAFQLQKMLEKDARGGTRYVELIKSHFGVTSPDARLQRAEYLGGGSQRMNISQIPQTESSDASTPQGTLAAYGHLQGTDNGFVKSFTEHCFVIGLVSVRADLTYQQGINRMFSRQTREDHYFPALAHLGEQEVLNKEIFADGSANDDDVFGYQERWAEYRYKPSQITGTLRSTATTPLDMWHMSQEFASLPTLGDTFIQEDPPIDRAIAVPSEPHVIFDSYIELKCTRPLPVYSTPGMIDHF